MKILISVMLVILSGCSISPPKRNSSPKELCHQVLDSICEQSFRCENPLQPDDTPEERKASCMNFMEGKDNRGNNLGSEFLNVRSGCNTVTSVQPNIHMCIEDLRNSCGAPQSCNRI